MSSKHSKINSSRPHPAVTVSPSVLARNRPSHNNPRDSRSTQLLCVSLPWISPFLLPADLASLSLASRQCREGCTAVHELVLPFASREALQRALSVFAQVTHLYLQRVGRKWPQIAHFLVNYNNNDNNNNNNNNNDNNHNNSNNKNNNPNNDSSKNSNNNSNTCSNNNNNNNNNSNNAWIYAVTKLSLARADFSSFDGNIDLNNDINSNNNSNGDNADTVNSIEGSAHRHTHALSFAVFPALRTLELRDISCSLDALPFLLTGCETLTELVLHRCERLSLSLLQRTLALLPNLRTLTISHCISLADTLSFSPSALACSSSLRNISLTHCPHLFSRTHSLSLLPHTSARETLSHTLTSVFSPEALRARFLTPCMFPAALRSVDLSFTAVSTRDLQSLCAQCVSLTELTANACLSLTGDLCLAPSLSQTQSPLTDSSSPSHTCASTERAALALRKVSIQASRLRSISIVSLSLRELKVQLNRELVSLSVFAPQLSELNLSMLRQLETLSLENCLSLRELSVLGCERLSISLSVEETAALLSQWCKQCPRIDWARWLREETGGSAFFGRKEELLLNLSRNDMLK